MPSKQALDALLTGFTGKELGDSLLRCSSWPECHRQPLDATDEVRAQPLRLGGGLDVRQSTKELHKHGGALAARQVRAQAEVGTAGPECALLVRRAGDVEA